MPANDEISAFSMTLSRPAPGAASGDPSTWVVCLCAAWCGVCRDYRAVFDGLAAERPNARFLWVDVEDEEDLVGDLDVDTFPTLLVGQGGAARFLGPLLPQPGVLARLLDSLREPGGAPVQADAQPLLERIMAAHGPQAA